MKHLLAISLAAVFLLTSLQVRATVLPPEQWVTITLSDSRRLEVMPVTFHGAGNTLISLARTRDNRLITEAGGYWYQAYEDPRSGWQAGDPLVAGNPPATKMQEKYINPAQAAIKTLSAAVPERLPYRYQPEVFPGGFEQPLLVIRVAFSDTAFHYSDAEIAERFYGAGNSVAAYYEENSYSRFHMIPAAESSAAVGDGIVQVTLDIPHPDFGSSFGSASQSLVRQATAAAAPYINAAAYDRNGDGWLDPNELAVVVMVAGYEQAFAGAGTSHPRVWAHKSTISQAQLGDYYFAEYAMFGERHQDHLATIGVICHELGHLLLDLPDLYAGSRSGAAVGRWGLMGLGGWNSDHGHAGDRPGHMLAWSKEMAGFMQPASVPAGVNDVSLRAVSDAEDALQVSLDAYGHGERLLLEHRRQTGFDAGLPGSGLLVSRVNDKAGFGSVSELAGEGALLRIEEADGRSDLVANTNPGEPSDVYSSLSAGLQLAAEAGSAVQDVELLSVEAGLVAYMKLALEGSTQGTNIGLDDLPPNDFYGNYGGRAAVRMTLDTPSAQSADGVDIFLPGAAQVVVSVSRVSGDLLAEQSFAAVAGWNRLLLSQPLNISTEDQLVISISSRADGYHAPLAVDAQGMLSGRTEVESSAGFVAASFDLSARLLVTSTATAAAGQSAERPDEADSESASSSSSGGGALSPLWLLVLLAARLVRRQAVRPVR